MSQGTTPDENILESQLPKRDWRFWCIILSISISNFTSYLDMAVSTALPEISHELGGNGFVWVGSAYAVASTAILPLSGGLAQIFGRRITLLGALLLFALGSALSGAASSMPFLIGARTVQGIGAGGIAGLNQIVVSDLVPLRDRGTFSGILALFAMMAVCSAPVIAGALTDHGKWRWLFYLNLFTSGLCGALIGLLLNLKRPAGTLSQKLREIDWLGNLIIILASISLGIGLTWAGTEHPWGSSQTLVPVILGLFGMVLFYLWEKIVARHPLVPFSLMNSWTVVSGYMQTLIHSLLVFALVFYLPVYFQACKGDSPTRSGVVSFGISLTIAPLGIIAGASVTRLQVYRPQMWAGWMIIMIGMGLMSTLHADSLVATSVGFQVVVGVGLGILLTTTYFPVLAPLPVSANAQALSFFIFCRNFGQIWGITIGATILQNELKKHLPLTFLAQFPEGSAIAYQIIPQIKQLEPELQSQVQISFSDSLDVIWQVCIGIAGLGLLMSTVMKHHQLHNATDDKWAMENQREKESIPDRASEIV
ncbi:hypothetical protein GYMLUDRAFT_44966 [Collybiopsis luxurians FD-317 M1]|uniref:Major facilitator superfamily (MFS) profile domain-containing protein n=1 Tax=Collybiopsis luxurians FD-317 M1 TaxID=944289 RepID=A0A0D0CT90_9AGAR|nr:hypothetical protein GYMLUDRAFT_44966 [Collybiopsis luxurians FD-317 M1]